MKILYLHGSHSLPGGVKPTFLGQHGHEVLNPVLPEEDFNAAVKVAQAEFERNQPDVIVGSSRGAAVAMNMNSGATPLVLLCPAWKQYGTARAVKTNATVLHSPLDDVVPFADSEELVRNSRLAPSALVPVGNDHRLANQGPLTTMLWACELASKGPRMPTWTSIKPFPCLAKSLEKTADWLFGLRFSLFIGLVLLFAILRNGIFIAPNIDVPLEIAQDVRVCPPRIRQMPAMQYLLSSFLGPALAWATGANRNYATFALLHLLVFLVFFPLLLLQARRRFGDLFARCMGIAFAVLPLSTTVLTWLGNSDTFTFVLGSALFLCAFPPLLVLVGFLLGVNHFEQGVCLVVFTGLCQWLVAGQSRGRPPWSMLWAGIGLALGKLAVHNWLVAHHYPMGFGRLHWFLVSTDDFSGLFLVNLHPLLFSLFNVFWAALILLAIPLTSQCLRQLSVLTLLFLMALAIAALTLDETRVFALISWPLVMAFLQLALTGGPGSAVRARNVITAVMVSGVVVPPLMVWKGGVHSGVLFHSVRFLIDLLRNGGALLHENPFKPPLPFQ